MKQQATELVIGTRYWLDAECTVSGVYLGIIEDTYDFGDVQGNRHKYLLYDDIIPFASKPDVYVYQQES